MTDYDLTWTNGSELETENYVRLFEPANHPFWTIVFSGQIDGGMKILSSWADSPSSETHKSNARIAWARGQAVGGYVGVPGGELAIRRTADLFSLLTLGDSAIKKRLSEIRPVLPDAGEYSMKTRILSRIAVAPAFRCRGYGKMILEAFLNSSRGFFDRIVLEVYSENEPAKRLYETHGFQIVSQGIKSGGLEPYLLYELLLN